MLKLLDYAERLLVTLICIPFVFALAKASTVHPSFLLLLASELLAVIFILIRRPGEIAATPYAFAIAIIGTTFPLLSRPAEGMALIPDWLTTAFMFTGFSINLLAKLFLNRSFGIVAANRGVKRGGPYRVVRHPMYLGYITTQFGFLLANFSPLNVLFYGVAWAVQVLRIREEEKLLMKDQAYAEYSEKVRSRLIPGLY